MVSVRRVAPVLLFVIALPAFAQPRQTSTPPKVLHRVGDHWTAYNPPDPSTYPPNARTHTIVPGDTLWGLAQQYYGSGYLWPQLWESNTWITDAHWIYPGDVLLIEGEVVQAGVGAEPVPGMVTGAQVITPQPTQPTTGIVMAEIRRESPPVALGSETDVYCYGYIGHPNERMPNQISGLEDVEVQHKVGILTEESAGATVGDLLFIDGGANTGLVAGETYIVIKPGEYIYHPRTGQLLGRHYNYQGQIRILCTEDGRSRGIITQSCREMHVGDRLKPLPQLPIPIARIPELPGFCDPPSGRSTGYIVDSQDWDLGLAEGNLVQINLGRDDRIQPGDFLTVYRENPAPGHPRQVLGEIGILTTESRTATARIVSMRRIMYIGDLVELR